MVNPPHKIVIVAAALAAGLLSLPSAAGADTGSRLMAKKGCAADLPSFCLSIDSAGIRYGRYENHKGNKSWLQFWVSGNGEYAPVHYQAIPTTGTASWVGVRTSPTKYNVCYYLEMRLRDFKTDKRRTYFTPCVQRPR
ncbi:hypothetical protein [Nonomuraea endophytica]|uniref:Secreted protein n=1 Tax=Nonomuraea endophytica TaxID=714136 RepID=A0A7W8ELJ2_9ACTN|nr:hypothetical protein [Nonomuraea endophytica]MBB5083949.1 hypothetical protein [Nonomuraea endophytica]